MCPVCFFSKRAVAALLIFLSAPVIVSAQSVRALPTGSRLTLSNGTMLTAAPGASPQTIFFASQASQVLSAAQLNDGEAARQAAIAQVGEIRSGLALPPHA